MLKAKLCAIGILSASAAFDPAAASPNLLFILDASGSMWGKVDNSLKIDAAKVALTHLIGDLPPETKVGLMAYGHREKSSCTDVEMLLPVGHASPSAVSAQLANVKPNGKTPIAFSLEQSADSFVGFEGDSNNIVLISDGIETCDGDPCAAAKRLTDANINLKVHVVGFDISEEDRAQLECIAEQGKGRYFAANSTEGLVRAISEAVQVAQAPAPEPAQPPKPTSERVFFDDFDGSGLTEYWNVANPASDAYLVEDGKLLLFSGRQSGFHDPQMANLVTLKQDFPDGDWDAIVRFSGEFASGRDQFWVGLRRDENNFIAASLSDQFTVDDDYHGDQVWLNLDKRASSESSNAPSVGVFAGKTDEQYKSFMKNIADSGATITISKRGRSYSAALTVDGVNDDKGKSIEWATAKLTSLRSPGSLTIGTSLYEQRSGELLVFVDSVEIVKVSE